MNSTWDGDDRIICQRPTGAQRAASLLPRRVPVCFWLECLRATGKKKKKKEAFFLLVFKAESTVASLMFYLFLYRLLLEFFSFHFGFIAFSFYVFLQKGFCL